MKLAEYIIELIECILLYCQHKTKNSLYPLFEGHFYFENMTTVGVKKK